MAPIGLVLFISSMGIMEGKTTSAIKEKFETVSRVRTRLVRVRPWADRLRFPLSRNRCTSLLSLQTGLYGP